MFDGLSLDSFAPLDDSAGPAEVGIGERHVVQALMVALVMGSIRRTLRSDPQGRRQEVVFQEDAVLRGLVPTLNLALGLRVERGTAPLALRAMIDFAQKKDADEVTSPCRASLGGM